MSVEIVPMSVEQTDIDGLLRITTKAVTDERGTVREFFRTSGFAEAGVPVPERWAQLNLTWTKRGGLRGMHGEATDKLVGVAAGEALGAYLDARPDSPTRGAVVTVPLTVGTQVFVPAGVCNGFQAVSDGGCQYLYCFGVEWQPGMSGVAVTPLDPALGIAWPVPIDTADPAQISAKDAAAPRFEQL
ncbi:dTDP-4-dehydrorhamnose 3,5-epimerase family protein [uncultured Jatrophihabitans sp.]|uniref:dTDP-4-dehydrorhamnose 3,5-epimerase family protein n=1 Tax=uncultured Jatrophihabitans sp. TaxID=1610747 RepID=UPI0035CA671B